MDSLTHIYFADRLLRMVGRDSSAAICSLFPQIDRQPAYFHRMYAHPFFSIGALAELGAAVYREGRVPAEHEGEYAWVRFLEERERMRSFADEYERVSGVALGALRDDRLGVLIGYASHTYQDIFNNPMQGFLPRSVYPSGKWDLWATLDAIEFRAVLYAPAAIAEFRQEFFTDPLWDGDLEATGLLMALVERTAAASIVELPRRVIDDAYTAFGLDATPSRPDVRRAREFLVEQEDILDRLIRKYARRDASVVVGGGHPVSASYPVGS